MSANSSTKNNRYKVLITGVAATGKSTLGIYLREQGYPVIETDRVSGWMRRDTGQLAEYNRAHGTGALSEITWNCDTEKLLELVDEQRGEIVFVCGYTDNQSEYLQYFDKVFLLSIGEAALKHRLATRTTGDWGKDPTELQHVLESVEPLHQLAMSIGAEVIFAERPTDDIAQKIFRSIHAYKSGLK
jgi:hypothetical protein